MLNELSTQVQETLISFENTPYFKAYREYVLLQAGKCLGMLRTPQTRDDDMYYKGIMRGVEMLILDLYQHRASQGDEALESANLQNRDYTEKLLEQDMKTK